MNYIALFLIVLHICPSHSMGYAVPSDRKSNTRINSNEEAPQEFSVLRSIIFGLASNSSVIDFEVNQCKRELLVIKKGIKGKDLWALKRK